VLAIDASPYAIRVVVAGNEHQLVHSYECKPHEVERAAQWIGRIVSVHPGARVVGSPLDDWPIGLEQALRRENVSVHWLSPRAMKAIYYPLHTWNQRRRLHRARLLGFLALEGCPESSGEAVGLVREWERRVAEEILTEL